MSAIIDPKVIVSADADYRRGDYMFSRTQSRSLGQLDWERSTPALRSRSRTLIPVLTTAITMALALAALY
jgi:hypothetical protein